MGSSHVRLRYIDFGCSIACHSNLALISGKVGMVEWEVGDTIHPQRLRAVTFRRRLIECVSRYAACKKWNPSEDIVSYIARYHFHRIA